MQKKQKGRGVRLRPFCISRPGKSFLPLKKDYPLNEVFRSRGKLLFAELSENIEFIEA